MPVPRLRLLHQRTQLRRSGTAPDGSFQGFDRRRRSADRRQVGPLRNAAGSLSQRTAPREHPQGLSQNAEFFEGRGKTIVTRLGWFKKAIAATRVLCDLA